MRLRTSMISNHSIYYLCWNSISTSNSFLFFFFVFYSLLRFVRLHNFSEICRLNLPKFNLLEIINMYMFISNRVFPEKKCHYIKKLKEKKTYKHKKSRNSIKFLIAATVSFKTIVFFWLHNGREGNWNLAIYGSLADPHGNQRAAE